VDLSPIAARLGALGVVVDPVDRLRFEEPARGAPGPAAAVLRPATVDEVRAVIEWARRQRVQLLPQGANTGLVGASTPPPEGATPAGAPPERDVVVLSLERLVDGLTIDPVDRVAVVPAGLRLSALDHAARAHGLHLPIDLSADPSLGGMVATNTGGSRVLRHGPLRRHVLGIEVVFADDAVSVVRHLDAVRKDSRGVELAQLLIGSGGTLGVVTRVAVALTPVPEASTTWWIEPRDDSAVSELLARLEQDLGYGEQLSALELVSAGALDAALTHQGQSDAGPFGSRRPPISLLAEWSGAAPALEGLEQLFATLADEGLVLDAVVVPAARSWALRHAVNEGLRARGVVLGHDVATPRPALMHFRAQALAALRSLVPRAEVSDFGHVGDGGLHCNVVFPRGSTAPPSPEERAAIRAVIEEAVADVGGTYSAEHGLGPVNAARWLATTSPVERSLVAAMKATVDPVGILGHPRHPYNQLGSRLDQLGPGDTALSP
jgi:FAD/FMN-containing dehydrogenase